MAVSILPAPSILIRLLTLINMKYKKAPSAHDELIRLYIWPCYHRWTKCFTSRLTNAGRQTGGVPDVGVFFQAIHANALLSCGVRMRIDNKKAAYNCILVVTLANIFLRILVKAERMCKRLQFIAYHGNEL